MYPAEVVVVGGGQLTGRTTCDLLSANWSVFGLGRLCCFCIRRLFYNLCFHWGFIEECRDHFMLEEREEELQSQ